MRVGVGITTYNRSASLRRTIEGVLATSSPDVIVVADDGSTDDTDVVMSEYPDIRYLQRQNGGIARNKNRVLFRLFAIERCDVVVLLEDDTVPTKYGWLNKWAYGAICSYSISLGSDFIGGLGVPEQPYICRQVTAQCWAISWQAWRDIGYLDYRFRSYGYEHAEWQRRAAKAGYGGKIDVFYCLSDEDFFIDHEIQTTGTPQKIEESFEVLKLTVGDTGYKPPAENMAEFMLECLTASER